MAHIGSVACVRVCARARDERVMSVAAAKGLPRGVASDYYVYESDAPTLHHQLAANRGTNLLELEQESELIHWTQVQSCWQHS